MEASSCLIPTDIISKPLCQLRAVLLLIRRIYHCLMDSDNLPMEIAQEAEKDTDYGQLQGDRLATPVILRAVLQHFSTRELLQLSLVNRRWNSEARSVLRDRRSLTKTLNRNRRCEDLRSFASDLKRLQGNSNLLSGLTIILGDINWRHQACCTESSTGGMNQAYEDILNHIAWRHLSVKFNWEWTEEFQSCPGLMLAKTILERFGSALEELSFRLPIKPGDFFLQCIQGSCNNFLRLKILTIEQHHSQRYDYTSLIKAIVSRAPNLQVLHTSGWVNLNGNLLEGSPAVLVTDYCDYEFSFLNEIPETVVGRLRMKNLELLHIDQGFDVERFNRITSTILRDSRTTLSSLCIDVIFLVPLSIYGICLENIETLLIFMDHQQLEFTHPRVLRLLKTFDFNRILPKLTEIKLRCSSFFDYRADGIGELVEQGDTAFKEPMADRAVNIKDLRVDSNDAINDSLAGFLAEMFPDIEALTINGTQMPYRRIWEFWRDLKALDVTDSPDSSLFQNLDSVFCGIFPEEVAELRKQDDDYLARVNIVPVMPAVTCLKGLRNLHFAFDPSPAPVEDEDEDPTYLFSKVTCLTAFQRCPDLSVHLKKRDLHRQRGIRSLARYVHVSEM